MFCIGVLPGILDAICLPAYLVIFSWMAYGSYKTASEEQKELDSLMPWYIAWVINKSKGEG